MILKKIRSILIVLVLITAAYVIQTCSLIPERFTMPNLLIMLTSFFGFIGGKKYGMYTGFVCGLLIDIFSGSVLGFNAVIFLYTGFVCGFFNKLYYDSSLLFPAVLAGGSDLIYNFVFYIIRFLLRNKLDVGFYFINVMLPEAIMTALFAVLLYKAVDALYERFLKTMTRSEMIID